ncbi:hypothetical protein NL676_032632 [Syzygium grande]|nr:hypothetical protein NL676_032632 [Syzygium grande]
MVGSYDEAPKGLGKDPPGPSIEFEPKPPWPTLELVVPWSCFCGSGVERGHLASFSFGGSRGERASSQRLWPSFRLATMARFTLAKLRARAERPWPSSELAAAMVSRYDEAPGGPSEDPLRPRFEPERPPWPSFELAAAMVGSYDEAPEGPSGSGQQRTSSGRKRQTLSFRASFHLPFQSPPKNEDLIMLDDVEPLSPSGKIASSSRWEKRPISPSVLRVSPAFSGNRNYMTRLMQLDRLD